MPGGQVEEGESLKDAAIRETKEESGLDIKATKLTEKSDGDPLCSGCMATITLQY